MDLKLNMIVIVFQVSSRHTDVSAVQQGLDQGEDLRAASSSGPAGIQVKGPLRNMEEFIVFISRTCVWTFYFLFGGGGVYWQFIFLMEGGAFECFTVNKGFISTIGLWFSANFYFLIMLHVKVREYFFCFGFFFTFSWWGFVLWEAQFDLLRCALQYSLNGAANKPCQIIVSFIQLLWGNL